MSAFLRLNSNHLRLEFLVKLFVSSSARELNNGNYEVLDGVRRFRALKAIHVTRVPIWILKDVKNDTDALIVSLLTNYHYLGLEEKEEKGKK